MSNEMLDSTKKKRERVSISGSVPCERLQLVDDYDTTSRRLVRLEHFRWHESTVWVHKDHKLSHLSFSPAHNHGSRGRVPCTESVDVNAVPLTFRWQHVAQRVHVPVFVQRGTIQAWYEPKPFRTHVWLHFDGLCFAPPMADDDTATRVRLCCFLRGCSTHDDDSPSRVTVTWFWVVRRDVFRLEVFEWRVQLGHLLGRWRGQAREPASGTLCASTPTAPVPLFVFSR